MKKKLISLLLAAMLVLSLLPMAALAVEDPEDVVPAQAGYDVIEEESAAEGEEEAPAAVSEEETPAVVSEDEEEASEEEAEPTALAEDEEPVADGSSDTIPVTVTGDIEGVEYCDDYGISGESFYLCVKKGYAVSVSGGKIDSSWSGDEYNYYWITVSADATEVTVTVTKKDAGTLSITGATDKVAVTKDGNPIQNGDALEWTDTLTITVAQGYVLSGQSGAYDATTGSTVYTVCADDLEQDGKAVVNIQAGVIVKYAGAVSAGLSGSGVDSGEAEYYIDELYDGMTLVAGLPLVFGANAGYVIDFSGVSIDCDTSYWCDSATGEVEAGYSVQTKSAGTLTVTVRAATAGELPTAIQVEYVDTDGVLNQDYSYKYVLPGNELYIVTEGSYTVQVEGATLTYFSNNSYNATWEGYVNSSATAVKATVVPIAEDAVLSVSGESGALVSEITASDGYTDSYKMDGSTLEWGIGNICLKNGYAVTGISGGDYTGPFYEMDENGDIYIIYSILATEDPVTVTVSKADPVYWVDVTITGETEQLQGAYSYYGEETDSSGTAFRIMSAENPDSGLSIYLNSGYTVKVTGGTVYTEVWDSQVYCYVSPDAGVESITVEIIAGDEPVIVPTTSDNNNNTDNNNSSDNNNTDNNNSNNNSNNNNNTDNNNSSDNNNTDNNNSNNNSNNSNSNNNSRGSENGSAPKTGDETNIALWAVLALGCGAGLAVVLTARKRREN